MKFYRLNKKHEVVPCSYEELISLETESRRIAWTKFDDGFLSTVFMPVEHPGGAFFETCLFSEHRSEVIARYATYKEALKGHKIIVSQMEMKYEKEKIKDDENS